MAASGADYSLKRRKPMAQESRRRGYGTRFCGDPVISL
jgi:hypothetical protein